MNYFFACQAVPGVVYVVEDAYVVFPFRYTNWLHMHVCPVSQPTHRAIETSETGDARIRQGLFEDGTDTQADLSSLFRVGRHNADTDPGTPSQQPKGLINYGPCRAEAPGRKDEGGRVRRRRFKYLSQHNQGLCARVECRGRFCEAEPRQKAPQRRPVRASFTDRRIAADRCYFSIPRSLIRAQQAPATANTRELACGGNVTVRGDEAEDGGQRAVWNNVHVLVGSRNEDIEEKAGSFFIFRTRSRSTSTNKTPQQTPTRHILFGMRIKPPRL